MNKDFINAIIRCAFRLCFLYILKFLLPPICLGKYISLFATDYNNEIIQQIDRMRKLLISSNSEDTSTTNHDNDNFTKTDNHDNEIKYAAYNDIKKNITGQLIEKYGDNICVDFTFDNENREKVIYSLKIKEIGKCDPDPKNFDESEIYVNTKTKHFLVKNKRNFETFPLSKRSIIKCERNL